jgi:hypothetical protein
MMIPVQYNDGRHDMVKPQLLDRLLNSRRVVGFKRSSGWVTVGSDPIRGQERRRSQVAYTGRDRRSAQH